MAPFRGRGGRARPTQSGRPARSGIRTRGGYKKFDSQRTRELEPQESDNDQYSEPEPEESDDDLSDDEAVQNNSYSTLLQDLKASNAPAERPRKRRRLSVEPDDQDAAMASGDEPAEDLPEPESDVDAESEVDGADADDEGDLTDPLEQHFVQPDDAIDGLVARAKAPQPSQKVPHNKLNIAMSIPEERKALSQRAFPPKDGHFKQRLQESAKRIISTDDKSISPYLYNYVDVLYGARTPNNAAHLRQLLSLHAVNHILKGRDRVIKHNARLAQADDNEMLEFRDQGFTRPKVLILCETRQMAVKYAKTISDIFDPEQQENSKRFNEAFARPIQNRDMPQDYNELFEGNNDNNFLTSIKFTRKTLKYYAAFYQSDIILASPLGIRRVIENEDKRKRDHDFLSSIEVLIVDQADASQMQSFENIEMVLRHLNLQPKELRDCDVNRVRNWYLDGNAKHFRQTVFLSAYLTPEMNKVYNSTLQNVAGKVKVSKQYAGVIHSATGLGMKQTFARFPSASPADDPDARFKYFTSSVLPLLLRLPRPSAGGQGILVFIPSYFDFLRVRNFFATSTLTENISYGAIHDYTDASDQRRARSHFVSGKHSILLYTQRAHHFFRLRIRGVKNVVLYGLPDNEIFYSEIVADYLGSTLEQGSVSASECAARVMFSKFDALKLERIAGSNRVKNMLSGVGDTFDFV